MEKHTCKLCSRTFSNGRALGGHMRSHVTALSPSPNLQKILPESAEEEVEEINESSPSFSSASEEEEDDNERRAQAQAQYYGLRENPKKSFRIVDPEFFAIDEGSVIQDRESETESSKNHLRKRSKRKRRSIHSVPNHKAEPEPEPEPVSSISYTTPEEDVARSLMMLSRDIWMRGSTKPFDLSEEEEEEQVQVVEEEEEEEEEDNDEEEELRSCPRGRSKYQCGTCKKVFRSYQALGGHRASHKKIRTCAPPPPAARFAGADSTARNADHRRIHECPVCFRVFKSGQALGGHKRSHVTAAAAAASPSASAATVFNMIDLNLPAPVEDDDFSQLELSAVSQADFIDDPIPVK
ncbi:zinc finger protein ZAT1-like protein [Cinnamomum micranthum f. kanehirae]|uniref:Zinc finger protein ZAT1-like protein n=1 Tax=Cinnamomum micranthum f. kanehirae TaxID=337451 RepID=A0A443PGB4_9MAGN|nr:zinc finger protein ZAT1-like protein [Cinnamomum micranthum f. kanehirae]